MAAGLWRTLAPLSTRSDCKDFNPHLFDHSGIAFDGRGIPLGISAAQGGRNAGVVHHDAIEELSVSVIEQGAHMVGGGEVRGLAWLRHEVDEVRLEERATPRNGFGNVRRRGDWERRW